MISVYLKEIEHNQRIDASIEKNKENFKLMELIYNYPGITIKDIFEYFKNSIINTDCLNRLSEMENGGILLTRKIGASKYYELSKFGLDLFKNLRGD